MTAEEWKEAEEMVCNWKIVELLIDEYKIQLQLQRIKMELFIVVYVNGKIKGEWIKDTSEESKKFWCESKKSLLTKYDKKKLGLTKNNLNP